MAGVGVNGIFEKYQSLSVPAQVQRRGLTQSNVIKNDTISNNNWREKALLGRCSHAGLCGLCLRTQLALIMWLILGVFFSVMVTVITGNTITVTVAVTANLNGNYHTVTVYMKN
jgi:hypothetical protein